MICPKCGISYEGNFCPNGCNSPYIKHKKPIYKKWWFWVIIAFAMVIIISAIGSNSGSSTNNSGDSQPVSSVETEEIVYEKIDLQTMLDELNANALKAETTYQDKFVEITGEITNFDSDGDYISIEPVNADKWNIDTVVCYIQNEKQLNFLLEKSTGDEVTIKGQVTSIGEVLGYSIEIAEIS